MWFKNNTRFTSKTTIVDQMNAKRPLPMGRAEFDEWAERIMSGSLLPCEDKESIRFSLATMLMHLGPQESHKEDAYFIHSMRKAAVNQVAHSLMVEIKEAAAAKKKAEEEAKETFPTP